ncbi:MAG: hypothetical protein JWM87_3941 [Candidatus Eremiobacteraeota bacterium]|nr:hypothetical protein [Candidatus Eremiobacteraeota bacterium]
MLMATPFPPLTPAADVAGVIERIDAIIVWARANQSRLGFFAALYKRVTRAIGKGIEDGLFHDGPRMERFDATFANRYFAAISAYFYPAQHPAPSHCWRVAFEAAERPSHVILLHMLAGMNAHIDLDLGITAWEIAKPGPLAALQDDFNMVNTVLTAQVKNVLDEIDEISPVLADIYDVLQKDEINLIDDGLIVARDRAWDFARLLAGEPSFLDSPTIGIRDLATAVLGALLLNPPPPFASIVNAIAARENPDVAHDIDELNEIAERALSSATAYGG